MKKVSRENIDTFGEESVAFVEYIPECRTYGVVRRKDGFILAFGKELKGYLGDIIRTMYDDTTSKSGVYDYVLESDRHGTICKFKAEN